jgi:hypothetical protein
VNDEENISKDLKKKFTERILDYVLYDVANNQTLRNFEPIKHNTHCTFARSAVLWGAPDYREDFSLENNVEKLGFMIVINLSFWAECNDQTFSKLANLTLSIFSVVL